MTEKLVPSTYSGTGSCDEVIYCTGCGKELSRTQVIIENLSREKLYDLDRDGITDKKDIDILARHIMNRKPYDETLDLNGDGIVDAADLTEIKLYIYSLMQT